jgi:type IV pilus assembly protein PilC
MNATYEYRAVDEAGKIVRDYIGAESKQAAIESLKRQGLNPVAVVERGSTFDIRTMFSRRPQQRLIMFRSLAQLFENGIINDDAFEIVINQAKLALAEKSFTPFMSNRKGKERFLRSLISLKHDVSENGVLLHEAMAKRPREFTAVEAAMTEAGHETGDMASVFQRIAKFLELDRKTSKQLSDAMVYPWIVMVLGILVVSFIMLFVIPQFAGFYKGFDVPIPPAMTMVLGITATLEQPLVIFAFLGAIGLAGFFGARYLATPAGALAFDKARMRIPILGPFFAKSVLVRLTRVLAMLLRSGKIHTEVLAIAAPVVGSPVFATKISVVRKLLDDGLVGSLYEAFAKSNEFDPQLIGLLQVGAKTGDYATPLEKIATYYEEDVESAAARFPQILSTMMTVVLGVIVGGVLTLVYGPLSSLSSSIH